MLYFCTINHGKFPFFQKTVSVLGYMRSKSEDFRIYYTVRHRKSQPTEVYKLQDREGGMTMNLPINLDRNLPDGL